MLPVFRKLSISSLRGMQKGVTIFIFSCNLFSDRVSLFDFTGEFSFKRESEVPEPSLFFFEGFSMINGYEQNFIYTSKRIFENSYDIHNALFLTKIKLDRTFLSFLSNFIIFAPPLKVAKSNTGNTLEGGKKRISILLKKVC